MSQLPESLRRLVNLCVPVHAYNVSELAERAAPLLRLDPALAGMAGLLHDIGKLSVPAEVLNAEGPLVGAEWTLVMSHPVEGEMIVRRCWPEVPEGVLHAVRHHHERLDGQGYPDRLKAVPTLTALVAAADVYDALRSDRTYRSALSIGAARYELMRTALPERVLRAVLDIAVEFEVRRSRDATMSAI